MKNGCVLVYGGLESSFAGREFFIQECESSWKILKTFKGIGYIKKMHFVSENSAWAIIGGSLVRFEFDIEGPVVTVVKRDNDELYLEDLFFINESIGWACGKDGLILRTTDGGQTWKEFESGTNAYLYKIRFADSNFGWALGRPNDAGEDIDGYLVTKDSGQNWAKISLPDNGDFSSVYFTSLIHGCGIASRSEILCTVDGKYWNSIQIADENRGEIFFTDSKDGWIVGTSIMKTTNGGRTWKYSLQHKDKETRKYQGLFLDDIYFANEKEGWAWGLTSVYKTQNKGKTWQKISDEWRPALRRENEIQQLTK
jgi:photosystem II stability/assembly factor-like uncharacterized protein